MTNFIITPMKGPLTIVILVAAFSCPVAQNLVPNPSLESYTSCPITYGELEKAAPWNKPTAGSTDYFNACASPSSPISVPSNFSGGYQYAHSGDGYAGITTYKETYPDYREYMQVELTSPLQGSQCYFFEMFINKKNTAKYASANLGAHIRTGAKLTLTSTYLNLNPQIQSDQGVLLEDTASWISVNGYYNALGGEDHLLIGNFRSDAQTPYAVHVPSSNEVYAYYYIDDVSLTLVDDSIDLGPDTLLCQGESLDIDIRLPGATYEWSDGDTSGIKSISQSGIYSVKVFIGQCAPLQDSLRVSMVSPPAVDFGPDTSICLGASLTLEASVPYGSYEWQDAYAGPSLTIHEEGLYWVSASNMCGTEHDTISVEIMECEDVLFVPNAFTPNGDGVNDKFSIKGSGLERYDLYIYDRWGRLVFRSTDPVNQWDGTSGGAAYPGGIYHWVLYYTGGGLTQLEKENRKHGFVYLLR